MGGAARGGSSEDREEKKIPSYSKQFQYNYKVTKNKKTGKDEVKKKFLEPLIRNTPAGTILTNVENKLNYDRRLKYAEKKGINLISKSKEYVTSPDAKRILDAAGYDDYNKGLMSGNVGNQDRDNNKSNEQPNVASQMDNTGVKSDLITADKTAPTTAEMEDSYDEAGLKIKRRGRKSTLLTSNVGDTSKATLSKKVLLGG